VEIKGFPGLRALLLSQGEEFVGTVTEKLMTYGLGRTIEYYDKPAIRQIVKDAEDKDYRWSSIILGIVESPQFLTRSATAVPVAPVGQSGR
jgi:hypothetical protein